MTDPRPRPRAFRLEDGGVAREGQPEVRPESAPIPDRTRPEPLDEAEREIEAAQRVGIARRWRPSLATLVWTGLSGLVSLALAL